MTNERMKENVLEEVSPQYCGARDLIDCWNGIQHLCYTPCHPQKSNEPFLYCPVRVSGIVNGGGGGAFRQLSTRCVG